MPNPPPDYTNQELEKQLAGAVQSVTRPRVDRQQSQTRNFESTLDWPDGLAAPRNAKLTLTIRCTLLFVDRKTMWGVAGFDHGNVIITDGWGIQFLLRDWDDSAKSSFIGIFEKAGEFWNDRFRLRLPDKYGALSYPIRLGDACIPWRPDVDCYFRLKADRVPHLLVYAFRPETFGKAEHREFSASTQPLSQPARTFLPLDPRRDTDYHVQVFAHELGHVMGLHHIGEMLGVEGSFSGAARNVDERKRRLDAGYREPPGVLANIMGSTGTGLLPLNAYGWQTAMEKHTGVGRFKWEAVVK